MKQHDIEAYTESMFAGVVVDYSEENERLRTALEQIRELQRVSIGPSVFDEHTNPMDVFRIGWQQGQYEAAQIADAALAPLPEHSPMPGEGDRDMDEGDEAGGEE